MCRTSVILLLALALPAFAYNPPEWGRIEGQLLQQRMERRLAAAHRTPTTAETAQDTVNIEVYSEMLQTGRMMEVAIEGERLYAATGYGIEVFDISEADTLIFLGRHPTAGSTEHIAVKNGVVYAADWHNQAYAIDARDPERMVEIWSTAVGDAITDQIRVFGDRMYLCVWLEGIRIYDVSQPEEVHLLGTYTRPRLPSTLFVRDSLTYVGDWDFLSGGLHVADLRDPQHPLTINTVGLNTDVYFDIWCDEGRLYVAGADAGLLICSLEAPTAPEWIATFNPGGEFFAQAVTVQSDLALISAGTEGLYAVDVSDPERPDPLDIIEGYAIDADFAGETFFGAFNFQGLKRLRLTDADTLETIAKHTVKPVVYDLAVFEQTVYVTRYDTGLLILDASDPRAPDTAMVMDESPIYRVASTRDGWLYTTTVYENDDTPYLQIWSLDNPHAPEYVTEIPFPDRYPSLQIFGDLLVASFYDGPMELWDLTFRDDPSLIVRMNDVVSNGYAYIDGPRLYASHDDGEAVELRIYDLRVVAEPQLVGRFTQAEWCYGIAARGNFAFLADGNHGVLMLDVTNPAGIGYIRTLETDDWAVKVEFHYNALYVCDQDGGLQVWDLSNPRWYARDGWINTPGLTVDLIVEDGVAYVADYYDLTILRYTGNASGVQPDAPPLGDEFALLPAYPNPFNQAVTIPFYAPMDYRGPGVVTVMDMRGCQVRSGHLLIEPGINRYNLSAEGLAGGVYYVDLRAFSGWTGRQKVVFLR